MVFSSQLFIYGFMPVFFSLYYFIDERRRNGLLLAASLLFYSVGAGVTVLVLLASVVVNQYLAERMQAPRAAHRQRLLAIGVTLNVIGLVYYKYTTFLCALLGNVLALAGIDALRSPPSIPLPIGISFFTFQAISYLVDVYRRDVPPAAGYGEFAVYHTLFPQLVAGPIVRYREISGEMLRRRIDQPAMVEGAWRFCLGIGKKIVIADPVGAVADAIFALPAVELSPSHAWLGILCYTVQIYFDFSGYSDMAIGLGRLLGFHFPENFNQPYRSTSITEFWRRWHMTLSRWFRDYLYFPLGGNRRGTARTYLNLCIVFLFCGLWHGAGLTFIVWGLYHGSLLILERVASVHLRWRPARLPAICATFLLVMVGWVFFRATSLPAAGHYLAAMFLLGPPTHAYQPVGAYLTADVLCYLAIGLVFAFVPFGSLDRLRYEHRTVLAAQLGLSIVSLLYSTLLLAANSFNPFIYFRF